MTWMKLTPTQQAAAKAEMGRGASAAEVAEKYGVSKVYAWKLRRLIRQSEDGPPPPDLGAPAPGGWPRPKLRYDASQQAAMADASRASRTSEGLTVADASRIAIYLEAHGWRAESCQADFGRGYVEVRDLAVRWHPLIAVIRCKADFDAFLPRGHGLRGRVPVTSEHGMKPTQERFPGHAGSRMPATDWPTTHHIVHPNANPYPE